MILAALGFAVVLVAATFVWIWRPRAGQSSAAIAREEARRQLAELEQGGATADPQELARARSAIKRRLLHAAQDKPMRAKAPVAGVLAAVALVAGVSIAGYWQFGRPQLSDTTAVAKPQGEMPQLLKELEKELQATPSRHDGWALLGRSAAGLGQFQRAANAYARAARAQPDNPEYWIAYGVMLTEVTEGLVTPAAELAFNRAAEIAPDHPGVAYYRGLALVQKGEVAQALEVWRAAADSLPSGSPLRQPLDIAIANFDRNQARQEIAQMPADEQMAMIRSMVVGLAARLEAEPDDPDGWLRLARSYEVLGQMDQALAAYRRVLPMLEGARAQSVEARVADLEATTSLE